ncbi:MAG: sigma-70 family polymerase sigma factor [Thermoleophilia bacterium]|nr:sigma-70 family polymerase sigma factor [Thermoleophilia bacterium]
MQGDAPPPFQASYVAHRGAVLRLLVGMIGPQEAEDCFSETFLKALRAWPPADRERVEAWLLSIAHRTALDALRRSGREVATGDVPEVAVEDDLASLDATALWDAVRRLPPKQRGAVMLRSVLDMSHAQVAAVLECNEVAARRSYADGIAALRGMEVTR